MAGLVLAVLLPAGLQLLLLQVWHANLTTASLVQLTGAVGVALVGGIWPALLAAFWSSLLLNYFMTAPTGQLLIHDTAMAVALVCFVAVAGAVAWVVDVSARRAARARRAGAEATALNELTRVAIATEDPLRSLLEQARQVFNADAAALFVRPTGSGLDTGDESSWVLLAGVGQQLASPDTADTVERVDDNTVMALLGPHLAAAESRLLKAFAAQATALRARQQLMISRLENERLAQDNLMRGSILQAVSHDLRTPLAGIKFSVSSLLQQGGSFSTEEQRELLQTTDAYADQLELLVENLLDMSRISARSVGPLLGPVHWEDVLPEALRSVPPGSVTFQIPDDCAPVEADPGLLERVIANLVENAARHAHPSTVTLQAGEPPSTGSRVQGELRIIDAGTSPLPHDLEEMFKPFQRMTDSGEDAGVGLGLAVARGLTEAMGGTLNPERTPGRGLTMVLRLPLAAPRASSSAGSESTGLRQDDR
ncbi:ATP-binding protein [Arthrobacter sp. NPDC089319]|uniref:sensor histidine kinase n=1 Tax=Arthrobacter sp. NPDC089319 TaxID=3155915 RepID=UPI00343ED288